MDEPGVKAAFHLVRGKCRSHPLSALYQKTFLSPWFPPVKQPSVSQVAARPQEMVCKALFPVGKVVYLHCFLHCARDHRASVSWDTYVRGGHLAEDLPAE